MLAEPDGSLRDYLRSLDRLSALDLPGPVLGLPGHGPVIQDLGSAVPHTASTAWSGWTRCVRRSQASGRRLPEAESPLPDTLLDAVTGAVYADVDPSVLVAARSSVRAQLEYLRGR